MAWTLFGSNWLTGIVCWWPFAIVDIPNGWHNCDGDDGTPDYRNYLLIGAGDLYTPGQVLGALSHKHAVTGTTTLSGQEHDHEVGGDTDEPHSGSSDYTDVGGAMAVYQEHHHDIDVTTGYANDDHNHYLGVFSYIVEHLPPCKAGCWIMKI